jgi:putative glutathione S-transferase
MRMLSSAFDEFAAPDRAGWTYAPKRLLSQIDEESKRMQAQLNAGVYKAGFARKQEDYEAMVAPVFEALDHYEAMLAKGGPFLLGEALTELDVRFYATVIRFDTVCASACILAGMD